MSDRIDAVVIGAGIVGAACAYRLSQRGLKVIVLEAASAPATGSTGKSAAGVRVQFTSETNVRLSWESIKEYRDFEALTGESAEYRPIGYLFLVPPESAASHLAGLEVQRRVGVPVEALTPLDAQKHVPFDISGVAVTTFGAADGVIDPHRVTLTYLRLARSLGCEVRLDSPLTSAERFGGAWRVKTPKGEIAASHVINAAGAWAGEVGLRAGLAVPVKPVSRMVFSTTPAFEGVTYPLTVDVRTGFYLRSEGARIIMGRSNPHQEPGFHEGVDWGWLDEVLEPGVTRFPWLADASLDRRACWWGYYEITPDHYPILGSMPGAEGWVNACGFSGHGVQQAAAVGRLIAEEVVDGRARSIDIGPLRIERFSQAGARTEGRSAESHIV
ncbi:MAG: FAD-binding oxidoreductase [Trueperaceae bacterium]|nr:FAD-binding oxidoreductase [Trueperaceae bacterium]